MQTRVLTADISAFAVIGPSITATNSRAMQAHVSGLDCIHSWLVWLLGRRVLFL